MAKADPLAMGANPLGRTSAARVVRALVATAIALGCLALAMQPAIAQDDDWTMVSRHVEQQRPRSRPPAPGALVPQSTAGGATMICGELARPASEPYTTIVAQIDQLWGVSTPVYEDVRPVPPHVNADGCVFYSKQFMAAFLQGETDRHGQPDKIPMIYAILAHEVGHFVHGDFTPARAKVPSVTKELDADRFAGYTLSRLGVPRDNITPYYSLGGDEFSGVHDHGFSDQRVAAFDQGWQRAEWNQPENSGAAAGKSGQGSDSDSAASSP